MALAHHVPLKSDVAKGGIVRWDDVEVDAELELAITLRR